MFAGKQVEFVNRVSTGPMT